MPIEKVLIVNDDGIDAEGIAILTDFAKERFAEITVVAPTVEQSAKSQALNLKTAFRAALYDQSGNVTRYTVDSTPADCVRFAINGLKKRYDLVLSGINRGANLGHDMYYSGTVGAATEASCFGIPAIAISTLSEGFPFAKTALPAIYDFFRERALLEKHGIFNVNFPAEAHKGILLTRQAGPYYLDHIVRDEEGEDLYRQVGYSVYAGTHDLSLDMDATLSGYISVTPLTGERTDLAILRALNEK